MQFQDTNFLGSNIKKANL